MVPSNWRIQGINSHGMLLTMRKNFVWYFVVRSLQKMTIFLFPHKSLEFKAIFDYFMDIKAVMSIKSHKQMVNPSYSLILSYYMYMI